MSNKKDIAKIVLTIFELAGIAGLAGIALWRNRVAYEAEIKAIDLKAERDIAQGLVDIQKLEIKYLQEELSKKENED